MADTTKDIQQSDLTQLLINSAGYRKSHILLTAISLEVFSFVEKLQDPGVHEIASELRIQPRSAEKLMGGLVALDLVAFDGSRYRNSATARTYLVRSSPFYLGDSIRTLFEIGQDTWGSLTKTIMQGTPIAIQRTDAAEAAFWPMLTKAIRPFNIPVAESTANLLLWKKDKIKKVLDLGGGSGVFGGAFLKAFPKARVVQVDWPKVNAEARKYNAEAVRSGRFKTVDGDLFETPWEQEGTFDVVVLSHIIHQEDIDRIKTLIHRIGNSIHENSEIIINEFAVNEKKNYPPYSLIFGLSMVLQNKGGGVYSFSEMNEMLSVINHEIYLVSSPVPPSTLFFSQSKNKVRSVNVNEKQHSPVVSAMRPMPKSFLSEEWDTTDSKTREQWLIQCFYHQLMFAKEHSVHWKKRLSSVIIEEAKFNRSVIESLPVFFKSELRILNPYDLTTDLAKSWHIVRGSGGTTGTPTTVMWTLADWRSAIETSTRFLRRIRDWKNMRIWNGYNQAHVAGPAFDDIIRMIGATPIPRHFKSTDKDTIKEMEHLKVDGIVLTPKSGSGKGGSLEDLLAIDPNFISRIGIKHVWVSSTLLDKDLAKELRSLGVETIVNFYGSTESMPNAISCLDNPHTFHLCQGHIFLEVLDENGKHVENGKRGTVVVSRIGSSAPPAIDPAEGTQMFRFVVGDSAVYHNEKCTCGLTSPRISQVERLPSDEGKILGGCERWD